jgi:Rod binding domain-containing protein
MAQIRQLPTLSQSSNAKTPGKFSNAPKVYHEIAEGMETQFINNLLTEMRKTVHSEEEQSHAKDYYNSLLDHERSKIMAQTENGIGLKEIILEQIVPQNFKNTASQNAVKMYQRNTGHVQGDKNE